jgi:23S rRNA (guanine2445-N2)-methyltransferase / 23S rRNA (guanine2069-N7)-methyltransferase
MPYGKIHEGDTLREDYPSPAFFASASRGTEEVLARELQALGLQPTETVGAGVAFGSTLEDAYRACLWSRVASRILMPLADFEAADPDALYEGVHGMRWTDHLGPERTLAVSVAGARSPVGPSHFIALKTKDAIVDRVRAEVGSRPSVDKRRPDVRVHVHVRGVHTTVSLDLAGRGLHRRGLGRSGGVAPIRENLAAALLHMTGWPERSGSVPLLDPMCGSGTFLVEAAGMALDVAPGLARDRTGLEGWRGHDRALWGRLRAEAKERRAAARGREVRIRGFDASPESVEAAREVVEHAGLAGRIGVDLVELRDAEPPWADAGTIVANPPYGARLGEAGELGPLYELLGDVLKRRFPGWSAWVLSGNRALEKRIGLRPAARHEVFNGPIRCRFLEIPISSERVKGDTGPAWRKPGDEARGFGRRFAANLKERRKWADAEGVACYRLYDADVPIFNLAVDWYDGQVRIAEYPRPRKVKSADAERRLREAFDTVAGFLLVDPADIVLQASVPDGRDRGPGQGGSFVEVQEADLRFRIDLAGRPGTGLDLGGRLLRRWIRDRAAGCHVLDLFSGTCTASVVAARGRARSTTSVEPSETLLAWGRHNFALNRIAAERRHRFTRADPMRFLESQRDVRRYDLIVVAPPTRSRPRRTGAGFDVERDHVALLTAAARRLANDGEIVFSTNLRTLALREGELPGLRAREITEEVTPPDFARRPGMRAWVLHATRRGRGNP